MLLTLFRSLPSDHRPEDVTKWLPKNTILLALRTTKRHMHPTTKATILALDNLRSKESNRSKKNSSSSSC